MARGWILIGIAIVVIGYFVSHQADPLNTPLPFGSTDLSSVEPQLAKLEAADAQLVRDYVARSNGDRMPASLGDPDMPLDATNFREAIAAQRKFLAVMGEQDARGRELRAARDAKLAPLRAVVGVELLARRLVPASALDRRETWAGGAKPALSGSGDHEVLVTTYRITNRARSTLMSAKLAIDVRRKVPRGPTDVLPLSNCWIEHREPLNPGDSTEVDCAWRERAAGPEDRAFAETPIDELVLETMPRELVLADGRTLEYRD